MKYVKNTKGELIILRSDRIQETSESHTGINRRRFFVPKRDLAIWLLDGGGRGQERSLSIWCGDGIYEEYYRSRYYRASGHLHLGCHHFDAKNSAIIIAWALRP